MDTFTTLSRKEAWEAELGKIWNISDIYIGFSTGMKGLTKECWAPSISQLYRDLESLNTQYGMGLVLMDIFMILLINDMIVSIASISMFWQTYYVYQYSNTGVASFFFIFFHDF